MRANVVREPKLTTDEARHYWAVGNEFAAHDRVLHGGNEYVRGDIHTNTIEGFFSIFKRGMKGVYQHCDEQYLHRTLPSLNSVNLIAVPMALRMRTAPTLRLLVSLASA